MWFYYAIHLHKAVTRKQIVASNSSFNVMLASARLPKVYLSLSLQFIMLRTSKHTHTHTHLFCFVKFTIATLKFSYQIRIIFASKFTSYLGKLPVTRHVLIYHEITIRDTVASGGIHSLIHNFRLDLTCITNIMEAC